MTQFDKHELFRLCDAVIEDNSTESELARLNEILDGNEAALQSYATYMMLHGELFWHAEMHPSGPVTESMEWSPEFEHRPGSLSRLSLAAMLMVGAALGILLVWAWSPGNDNQIVEKSPVRIEIPNPIVARITGTRNCRWADSVGQQEPIGYDSPVYAGQQLNLVDGFAEITFLSGVKVILQAPAKLDLSTADSSILRHGRMTASVPKGAEGFQIACNGITIIDRGTEFGLNSKESGKTEVRVFDGLVEGFVKTDSSSNFQKVSWKTNDSAEFDPNTKLITKVSQPSNFVRSLSQSVSSQQGILASEDFDYPVGRLAGQNAGFGWGGPWDNISIEGAAPGSNAVGAGSILVDGIDHLGNHAVLSGQFNRIRRILGTSFSGVFDTADLIENQDGARLIGKDGKTIYISFTQRVKKPEDVFYGFELNRGDGNSNRVVCVGHAAAKAWIDGPPRRPNVHAGVTGWAVTSEFNGRDNRLLELGDLGPPTSEPVLVVLKIEFGSQNDDQITAYVNPESLVDESVCSTDAKGNGNFAFDRISLANFEGEKSYEVDHIRIGTAFAAVTRRAGNLPTSIRLPDSKMDE